MSRSRPAKRPEQANPKKTDNKAKLSVETRLTVLESQISRRSLWETLWLPLAVSAGGTVIAFLATDRITEFFEDDHDIGIIASYADTVKNMEPPSNAPEGHAVLFVLVVNDGGFIEEEVNIEVQFWGDEEFELSTHFSVNMYNDLIFDDDDMEITTDDPTLKIMQTKLDRMHPDENTAFWFYPSKKVTIRAYVRSKEDYAKAEIILDEATPSANRINAG